VGLVMFGILLASVSAVLLNLFFSAANPWLHLTAAACGVVLVLAWGKFSQSSTREKPAIVLAFSMAQLAQFTAHQSGAKRRIGANPFCIQTKVAHNLALTSRKQHRQPGTNIAGLYPSHLFHFLIY